MDNEQQWREREREREK